MIGPAEIEDMLADYEEAVFKDGLVLGSTASHWPVAQIPVAVRALGPVALEDALERLRLAALPLKGRFCREPPSS